MCSNYDRFIKDKEIKKRMDDGGYPVEFDSKFTPQEYELLKQQDIRITDASLVVKKDTTQALLTIMQWGITWNPKIPIFNSRIETIKAEPRWTQIFKTGRCLIPATSFYEFRPLENDTPESKLFKKQNKIKKKTKFSIEMPDEKLFFIGGIYVWDKNIFTCSMITTNNHPALAAIPHHRSPYLIEPKDAQEYLEADPVYLLDKIDVYDKTKQLTIKQATEY